MAPPASKTRPPKKSECLEIRLPHPTKQAFMARCRAEGRSASEALRGFIDQQLAAPAPREARPGSTMHLSRKVARLAAGALIAASVGAVALPSLARTGLQGGHGQADQEQAFRRLDANGDGVVTFEEFRRQGR